MEAPQDTTHPFEADPTLKCYSAKQVAVASTWAEHFCIPAARRRQFLRDYLRSTSSTRCWTTSVVHQGQTLVICRLGSMLQWFDGRSIKAAIITKQSRIPLSTPSSRAALGLAGRLENLRRISADAVLTSFCRSARHLGQQLVQEDLGETFAGVTLQSDEVRGPHRRYTRPRTNFYMKQIGSSIKAFCSHLDPAILFALRSARCPDPRVYNWLAAGDQTRRLQALKAQPVLIPLIVILSYSSDDLPLWPTQVELKYEAPPWPTVQELTPAHGTITPGAEANLIGAAADQGISISDVLSWLFKAPKSSIRFLGTCRPGHIGGALSQLQREGRNAGWHHLLLGATAGNRRPRNRSDWKVFLDLIQQLPYEILFHVSQQKLNLNLLFKGCPTSWNDSTWPYVIAGIKDYTEIYRNLEHKKLDARKKVSDFFLRSNYAEIANKVELFHQDLPRIRAQIDNALGALEEADELFEWPPLLLSGPITCPNGIEIVELLCPNDLFEEELRMRHCVGSYDYSTYRGDCRIISLRHNSNSLATAELRIDKKTTSSSKNPRVLCAQLRAHRNAPVSTGTPAKTAFDWFLTQLNSGAITSNLSWPNLTRGMARYTRSSRQELLEEEVANWVDRHLVGRA
ncbi:PcfJ domain-containing protein [Pseudomonas sp. MSSRFD41]|uniref:PcfJ domain-containing protein n=1 Tax=Pseudomonas sp. MSSRFD41 TaxID=1310370 RepID=UPI0016399338|nr:PcfJ domain-containing protein [Pseudomonas sp. MSSRFD41]MBC2658122.1 PcfJ domain-containing protein [Pseudomonas sp. MSSRFD41]